MNFDYCVLCITISNTFQNFPIFFLVLQSSLAILLNYYRMILFGISLEKIRHKKRKVFDGKITII